jgi:hypothetical protein
LGFYLFGHPKIACPTGHPFFVSSFFYHPYSMGYLVIGNEYLVIGNR